MLTADACRQAEFGYTLAESRRGFKIHAAVYRDILVVGSRGLRGIEANCSVLVVRGTG